MSYFLEINQKWCKKCGLCMEECPAKVIGWDEQKTVRMLHKDKCTGCGNCIMICPDFAVFSDEVKFKEYSK